MKKIILAFFVFATGTLVNVQASKVVTIDCFEYADTISRYWAESNPSASHEDTHNVFLAWYDDCSSGTSWSEGEFYMY